MTELREKMTREMELRDFSPNTIDAYLSAVKGLAGFYMRSPDAIGQEEVEDYLLYLKKFKNYTANPANGLGGKIGAMMFLHSWTQTRVSIV